MNPDFKRGYSKGYATGSRGTWPDHRPPMPPQENVAALMAACRSLRDGIDSELATFDEDDELNKRLGPLIDAVDDQFVKIGRWLREQG